MKPQEKQLLDVRKVVGKNIMHYRKALGLSQHKLAAQCNISRSTISNMEIGAYNVNLNTLAEIAYELNVPLDYLFEGADHTRKNSMYDKLKTEYEYLEKKHERLLKEMTEVILRNG